jgi:hypothetical protein
MANSENTFGDRLTRAREMQNIILKFDPPFDPANTALQPGNFSSFLDLVETRNTLVATAGPASSAKVSLHSSLMATIKSRTTRVVDYVASNEAWTQFFPGVKQAANKVRNYHPDANKKETPAKAGEPPKRKIKSGQQSYGDIDQWFEKLIEAVKLVPNYKPGPGSNIEVAQLTTLLADYRQSNKDAAVTDAALDSAQRARKTIYDGTDGLRSKMKAIKKAVGAQYGRKSPEYAAVAGIAL